MPKGSLIDIGVNLNGGQFRKDIDDVLVRATDHGVMGLIAIASDVEESLALQQYDGVLTPMVWRTAGVHPHQAKTFNEQTLTQLKALLAQSRCVALGECGLDFNRNYSPPAMQTMAFESQVELACQSQVPLYLHERDAHDEVCQILRVGYQGPIKGVIHCFTGDQISSETILIWVFILALPDGFVMNVEEMPCVLRSNSFPLIDCFGKLMRRI